MLASKGFARSERMKRFLRFAVEQALSEAPTVKEYAVATAVYDRPTSFDPRVDPIVRVEASRLRAKLREYYEEEGAEDPVVISICKGSYSAVFRRSIRAKKRPSDVAVISQSRHLYLMGRDCWNKRSPGGIDRAIECFRAAIASDAGFAPAYAALADCYAAQAWLEMSSPLGIWHEAERQALKAQAIDSSTEAMAALAFKKAAFDWQWNDSETTFRKLIVMKPKYATAHHWYGFFCLAPQRRLRAATEEVAHAFDLDPISPAIATHLGCLLYFRRSWVDAVEQYRRAIEIDPSFCSAHWHLGFAQIRLSRFDEALAAFQDARDLGGNEQSTLAALGYLHACSGSRHEAERYVKMMNELSRSSYVSPVGSARIHAELGNLDEAFHCLDRAIREKSSLLIHLKIEPSFDRLKTDSRFNSVLRALDLL